MFRSNLLCILLLAFMWLHVIGARAQTVPLFKRSKEFVLVEKGIAKKWSTEHASTTVNQALARDRSVVEKAAPQVIDAFKREGYSAHHAVSGLAWSWYLLRVGETSLPIGKDFSAGLIQMKASKLGKLVVSSEPDGAAISVDEVTWPEETNTEGFADVGQRRIRVQKPGLDPAQQTCEVRRNRATTFSARLRVSGSEAECK